MKENMKNIQGKKIKALQENLSSIRKLAGWSTKEMGELIGVTSQTIRNLESGKPEMTLTQYLAIRTVLDYEIAENKENQILAQAVEILLEQDELNEEDYTKVKTGIDAVAAMAASGVAGATLATAYSGLVGPIVAGIPLLAKLGFAVMTPAGAIIAAVAAGVAGGAGGKWIKKIFKKDK